MSKTRHIEVDAGTVAGAMDHAWRFIGYDECNYTYMPEGKELLGKFGALGDAPYYVRTHFTFCNGSCVGSPKFGSTNVYHEDAQGNAVYDFTYYDLILDAILESGNLPFVELGFMPEDLADPRYKDFPSGAGMGAYREIGWSYPPKDYGRWADLIRATAAHLAERYGAQAVASWYFELWNEPGIFYWSGTIEDYCRLFDVTEQALHGVLPQARLGGPTVAGVFDQGAGREAMQAFLRHCKTGTNACGGETGTRLDFVTFHVKGAEFFADPNVAKAVPSVGNLPGAHRAAAHGGGRIRRPRRGALRGRPRHLGGRRSQRQRQHAVPQHGVLRVVRRRRIRSDPRTGAPVRIPRMPAGMGVHVPAGGVLRRHAHLLHAGHQQGGVQCVRAAEPHGR